MTETSSIKSAAPTSTRNRSPMKRFIVDEEQSSNGGFNFPQLNVGNGRGRGPADFKPRWIHCTLLLGSDDRVGAWMIIFVPVDRGGRYGVESEI